MADQGIDVIGIDPIVGIHEIDIVSLGRLYAGIARRTDPPVFGKTDHPYPWIALGILCQDPGGVIDAAVIDANAFEIPVGLRDYGVKAPPEPRS